VNGRTPGRVTVLLLAVMLLVGAAAALTGCGFDAVGEKVDSAVKKVFGGDDDEQTGSGPIPTATTSGTGRGGPTGGEESGATTTMEGGGTVEMSSGAKADLPAGFPGSLIPADAEIVTTMSFDQDGEQTTSVSFTSGRSVDDLYEWFLAEVPRAGFNIDHKMQFDTGGGRGFSILGSGSARELVVTGAGEGNDIFYTVAITGG